MKKCLLFLTGIVFCLSAHSQSDQPDSTIWSQLQMPDSIWSPFNKNVFNYSDNGNLYQQSFFVRDSNLWVPTNRMTHFYNDAGNETIILTEYFSPEASRWDTVGKNENFYNDNQKVIRSTYSSYSVLDHQWIINQDISNRLNEDGSVGTSVYSFLNADQVTWDTTVKYDWIYDIAGRDSIKTYSFFNSTDSIWNFGNRTHYFYNESGNDTLDMVYEYSQESWNFRFKTIRVFNEDGFNLSAEDFEYIDNSWKGNFKYDFIPDDQGRLSLIRTYVWDDPSVDWKLTARRQYYYFTPVNTHEMRDIPSITVFPNPAGNFIKVNSYDFAGVLQFQLFNLNGVKLVDQHLTGNYISTENLPRGTYVYQIMSDKNIITGKIVLK
jgi:hypothetical protein